MEKIQTVMVLEILGRPKEHVVKALEELIEKLGKEKGVNITNKEIHEPIPAQDSDTLFTTFTEVEVEFDTLENYLRILFNYMPANVEIMRPENLSLTNSMLSEIGSSIVQKLHNYDAITKKALVEREILLKKLKEVAPEELDKLIKEVKEKDKKPS